MAVAAAAQTEEHQEPLQMQSIAVVAAELYAFDAASSIDFEVAAAHALHTAFDADVVDGAAAANAVDKSDPAADEPSAVVVAADVASSTASAVVGIASSDCGY